MSIAGVPVLAFVPPPPVIVPAPVINPGIGLPVPGLPVAPAPVPGLDFLEPFGLPPFQPPAFQPSEVPRLPLPGEFPVTAIGPGPEDKPLVPASFQGGQCQGIQYRVRIQNRTEDGPFGAPRNIFGTGPVQGPFVRPTSASGPGIVTSFAAGVAFAGGAENITLSGATPKPLAPTILRVDLPDGQPDPGCGDPPNVQDEERSPNPARNFVPSPLFVPDPSPSLPPSPFPELPPTIEPARPETKPEVPGEGEPRRIPLIPFNPFPPGEIVPFAPATIPALPTAPQLPPTLVPPGRETDTPRLPPPTLTPGVPRLVPPFAPTDPLVPPQFPVLPPGAPTRQLAPPVVVAPPTVRIPPPVNLDCCALPEIKRQAEETRRKIDKKKESDECNDLCDPAEMFEKACEEDDNSGIITTHREIEVDNLSGAMSRLSRQVAEIAEFLNICAEPNVPTGSCPPPGDVGEPVASASTGVSGTASGQLEEGLILTGLLVQLLTVPESARQFRPGVFRGVGYFSMGTAVGLDQDYAGSSVRDGQFIFAEQCNLTHWAVAANAGYNILVTPYARIYEP